MTYSSERIYTTLVQCSKAAGICLIATTFLTADVLKTDSDKAILPQVQNQYHLEPPIRDYPTYVHIASPPTNTNTVPYVTGVIT